MIFGITPVDWKDLQNKVADVFSDMGCKPYVEKRIETARGSVTIDVYIEDANSIPSSIILCECKHWERPVPQSAVHSFRTVISDCGAHHGIIISKNGFQSGAYDASVHSNIKILSWDEFQEEMYPRWIKSMINKVKALTRKLVDYSNDENDEFGKLISSFNAGEREEFRRLLKRGLQFSISMMGVMENIQEKLPPIHINDFGSSGKMDLIAFDSKKALFEFVVHNAENIISGFVRLYEDVKTRQHMNNNSP